MIRLNVGNVDNQERKENYEKKESVPFVSLGPKRNRDEIEPKKSDFKKEREKLKGNERMWWRMRTF